MFKMAIKVLLLALLILLGSKVYIALMVHQSLSEFKESHRDRFLLTYKWISSDLNGTLSIENIELTPYVLKRTFQIERLDFTFENYLSLLTSLTEVLEGDIDSLESLSMPSIKTELKGRSFQQWLAENYSAAWFRPFGVYACGDQQNLSAAQYEAMGIKEFHIALKLEFSEHVPLQDEVRLSVDLHDMGRFQLELQLADNSFKQAASQLDFLGLSIKALTLNHQEAGFFRRLNVICNTMENKDRGVYSLLAASAWESAMHSQGLMVNQALVNTYREYLLRGGELALEMSAEEPFRISADKTLVDKELFDFFNAKLRLNGQRIANPQVYLDSQIIFPPPPEPVVDAPQSLPPAWTPGYRVIELDRLEQFIGYKLRVLMNDEKQYEGQLNAITEYNLDLSQSLPGGRVNYPLMFKDIERVEVWLNAPP